jgi:hypothetical protein
MILPQRAQTAEMVSSDSPRSLGFNGKLHIIDDEGDLNAAG